MTSLNVKTRPIPVSEDLRRRFWLKVDKSGGDDACWNFAAGQLLAMLARTGEIWRAIP